MLIENCLFGVDINPNSVKICRLRLWIELLKNAYYVESSGVQRSIVQSPRFSVPPPAKRGEEQTEVCTLNETLNAAPNYSQLETLPNIDINIKCGNSLISRFALDADLSQVLKTLKYNINDYRSFVLGYKETKDREKKREFEENIRQIKDDFKTEIFKSHPKMRDLLKLQKRFDEFNTVHLFDKYTEVEREIALRTLTTQIGKINLEIDAIKTNAIYRNAFEWRFEFPEVLNNDGNFLGFDIVIGNPPYISALELKKSLSEELYKQLKLDYQTAKGTVDLFIYFFERGLSILKQNMNLMFITPNRYLSASYGEALREYLFNNVRVNEIVDYSDTKVFEEASTYPITTSLTKLKQVNEKYVLTVGKYIQENESIIFKSVTSEKLGFLESYIWGYLLNDKLTITEKIIKQSVSIRKAALINATSTASEADEYHSLINQSYGWKLINTGTIDKYENLWGNAKLTDKGEKFLNPYLPKDSKIISANRTKLYNSPKIILAKIALSVEAYFDENGEFASINTNCFHSFKNNFDEKYVLSWLNSKLFQYTFECFFEGLKMQGGYLLYSSPNLSKMYIKKITPEEQKPFIELVDKILAKKKAGEETSELENQIDATVYKLYELSEDEIKIVEGKA